MNRLYQTIKKIKGIEYVYLGFGKKLKYVHPVNDPSKIDEGNVLHLLDHLDHNEQNDLSLYEEDRRKLVSLLSEAQKQRYAEKRNAELQTRLRPPTRQLAPVSSIPLPVVAKSLSRSSGVHITTGNLEQFLNGLKKSKREKHDKSDE